MPAPARTDSGFGGFAPVPYFRTPDGRNIPESYIDQAREAINFGPATPRTRPSPSPTFNSPAPDATPTRRRFPPGPAIDPSTLRPDTTSAGVAPPGLTGETLRAQPNVQWNPDTPAIPSSGGRSPPFTTDPNLDWTGTMTREGLWNGPDRAQISSDELYLGEYIPSPSEEATLPSTVYDEYIPTPPEGPTLPDTIYEEDTVGVARTGSSINVDPGVNSRPPTGPGYMAGWGGNMTLGQLLSTPLASMGFGENRGQAPVSGGLVTTGAGTRDVTPGTGMDTTAATDAGLDSAGAPRAEEPPELADIPEAEYVGGDQSSSQPAPTASDPTNPASRFGNLGSTSGQAVYFDGTVWRPTAGASSDIRWNPANTANSNAAVSRFSSSPDVQDFGHGMNDPAKPLGVSDEGRDRRYFAPNALQQKAQQMAGPVPTTRDPNFKQLFEAWNAKVMANYKKLGGR